MANSKNEKEIIISRNLEGYFYQSLSEANNKLSVPLPQEMVVYTSNVLDRYAGTQKFFEVKEGKVREKILGIKLLEIPKLTREDQKKSLLDIAETTLVVCGQFPDSINKKLIGPSYYTSLGQMAYQYLNSLIPSCYDVPSFYEQVGRSFEKITSMMTLAQAQNHPNQDLFAFFPKIGGDKDPLN